MRKSPAVVNCATPVIECLQPRHSIRQILASRTDTKVILVVIVYLSPAITHLGLARRPFVRIMHAHGRATRISLASSATELLGPSTSSVQGLKADRYSLTTCHVRSDRSVRLGHETGLFSIYDRSPGFNPIRPERNDIRAKVVGIRGRFLREERSRKRRQRDRRKPAWVLSVRIFSILAEFIRILGYKAIPMGNDTSLSIPLAIDAGLGELGRHGLLITPEYGPCVRLCKVFTDLPLEPDKPIQFGVTAAAIAASVNPIFAHLRMIQPNAQPRIRRQL